MSVQIAPTIESLLKDNRYRVLSLAEIQGVNLNDPWLARDARYQVTVEAVNTNRFLIWRPWIIECPLQEEEVPAIQEQLRARQCGYQLACYPPHCQHDQGEWWTYRLELDLSIWFPSARVSLVDFGGTFGMLSINDLIVTMRQDGGNDARGRWVETTYGFHLADSRKARLAVLESILACSRRPMYVF